MCYFWGDTGVYSRYDSKRKPKVLDFDVLKRLIRDLTPAKPSYSLFGGEPLTYPYLEELIHEVKNANSMIDTPTNGTLLEKHSPMLVRTGFDSVRVSLDGPREINDAQRLNGSYDRAIKGIETLHREKIKEGTKKPVLGIIYTVTSENYLSIEEFFLESLDLSYIQRVTIQMQNFLTKEMGDSYAQFLKSEFGIESDDYWRSMVRSPADFEKIDLDELTRQVNEVRNQLGKLGKNYILLPPTFSPENLKAYLAAEWYKMAHSYQSCFVTCVSTDITASGDVAPCHVFYDLTMGNLNDRSIVDIWNSEKYKKFRSYMKHNTFMPICHGCCILYLSGKKHRKVRQKK
jgi:radical SAM protein with 4Fe4S-binding SPASM domain